MPIAENTDHSHRQREDAGVHSTGHGPYGETNALRPDEGDIVNAVGVTFPVGALREEIVVGEGSLRDLGRHVAIGRRQDRAGAGKSVHGDDYLVGKR